MERTTLEYNTDLVMSQLHAARSAQDNHLCTEDVDVD
jgi:hypothetical protein